eukprot:TRINITY_DN84741_c0_g1_i1.p1 TRINITY_DN84741_c0_g1~~TRINITY_DN84741_c0_g1_i1.p1  ORF type:complete len:194 (+),score=48.73 TRINITY_DN84741_c0_g1_i1:57-584(+)
MSKHKPGVEESLDVLKRAIRESVAKAEQALDAQDGDTLKALQQSESQRGELLKELHQLRAEVARLRAQGGEESCGDFVDSAVGCTAVGCSSAGSTVSYWWSSWLPWCACSHDDGVDRQVERSALAPRCLESRDEGFQGLHRKQVRYELPEVPGVPGDGSFLPHAGHKAYNKAYAR